MLSALIKGISDLSVLTRAIFYSHNITACLPNFALRLFEFATSERESRVHVDAECLVAVTLNVQA